MNNKYLAFISIGFELVASIMIAIYLGSYITEKYQLSDIITVLLIFLFLGAWLYRLVLMLRKIQNGKNSE